MLRLSSVLFGLVATVLAGVGLMIILIVPRWSSQAVTLIPYSVGVAILVSIPTTWLVARLILRSALKSS